MAVLEMMLKAALLFYIYTFYSILIIGLTLGLFTLSLLVNSLLIFLNGYLYYTASLIELILLGKSFIIGYKKGMKYSRYLDIEIPFLTLFLNVCGNKIFMFNINFFPLEISIDDPSVNTQNKNESNNNSNIKIISPVHKMFTTTLFESYAEIELDFVYEGDNNVNLFYDIIRTDINEKIIDNAIWHENDSVKLSEGAYLLKVQAVLNGSIIDVNNVTFSILDISEIIQGFGSMLNLIGSLILLMDAIEVCYYTVEESLNSIIPLASSIFLSFLSYSSLGFSPSALIGSIFGTMTALIYIASYIFNFITGVIDIFAATYFLKGTVLTALSYILLILQILGYTFSFTNDLAENIVDYIDVSVSVIYFLFAMKTDKTVSLFACKYNWQIPHKVFFYCLLIILIFEIIWIIQSKIIQI